MNPRITLPRQHSHTTNPYAATRNTSGGEGVRVPRFFKRLFKFPQMDFELAVWEMTSLLIAPKKVFRNIYYNLAQHSTTQEINNAPETRNTWANTDPAFPYLLSFFVFLTALAWSVAYAAPAVPNYIQVTCVFVFGHCICGSLAVATLMYFLVGRVLGPGGGIRGLPGRRRRGLFEQEMGSAAGEELEFGYCFDVAIRAYFPMWVLLYVVQFLLMPVVARDHWPSLFLSNTLYLAAWTYYLVITFLGYNALPFLHHTELLLSPIPVIALLYFISLFGFNMAKHFAPILVVPGATMRKASV